jgi:hypothetical protein
MREENDRNAEIPRDADQTPPEPETPTKAPKDTPPVKMTEKIPKSCESAEPEDFGSIYGYGPF